MGDRKWKRREFERGGEKESGKGESFELVGRKKRKRGGRVKRK